MSTSSASWTESVAVTLTDASPASGMTTTGDIDLAVGGYFAILVQVAITWQASGYTSSHYADFELLGSADDGTTWDTIPYQPRRVDAVNAGQTNFSHPVSCVPRVRVSLNNQSGQEIPAVVVKYAGIKATSA